MIPIRTVFTISGEKQKVYCWLLSRICFTVTLIFVYGMATLVYVNGILSWTHFPGFWAPGSMIWMPPLVSFSICVGLETKIDLLFRSSLFCCRQARLGLRRVSFGERNEKKFFFFVPDK